MTTPYASPACLKVRGDTDTGAFSKSLRLTLEENGNNVTVRAMGPTAVNQMIKGLIVAQKDLAGQGKLLCYRHAFHESEERGNRITVVSTECTTVALSPR